MAMALLAILSALSPAFAGETLKGKVTEVAGEMVKISLEGEWVPAVGDKVEVYVEIPGLPEGAVVGTGCGSPPSDRRP
jgi:hypothetical protein